MAGVRTMGLTPAVASRLRKDRGQTHGADPRSSGGLYNPSVTTIATTELPARCRHRFPIFDQRIYINSCSQGALSDAVRGSYQQYLADWDEYGAPWEYWVERQESARAAFAGLVNAQAEEIAVTTSLSAGVSALASGLRFTRRSKVVLTDWEFPTIGQIWHAQEARGARVVHVAPTVEEFDRVIDDDTLLVSITHVCYRNGAMVDVPKIVEIAHERGALVLLDAFQSIGSLPVDVKELGVDFLGAGVLKYLLGSAGPRVFFLPPRLGGPRFLLRPPRADRARVADPDGLVRRREHLRDGPHRLLTRPHCV